VVTAPPEPVGGEHANAGDGRPEARLGHVEFAVRPLVRFGPQTPTPTRTLPPSLTRGHPFGTDSYGRDVFARVVHGARLSLTFGLLTALAFGALGAMLGGLAGFYGGAFDGAVTRLVEILSAFPTIALVLVVRALDPHPSLATMLLTIAAVRWTEVARIVRAEVLLARSRDYVLAARALGASPWRVLVRHVLPNAIVPAIVASTFGVAAVVLVEASVDFLGFGVHGTAPSWGDTMGDVRAAPGAWWLLVFPGLALTASLLALHLVAEALRDGLDPRLRDSPETTASAVMER
jgi:peptide/nickel transport system permease protein